MRRVKRIKSILGAPRRAARVHGYGIHSPWAFDFVRRVISQPCRYYCYPALNSAAAASHLHSRIVRLIFRVALFTRACGYKLCVGGDTEKAVTRAILAALPAARPSDAPELMVIGREGCADEALGCLRRGGMVILLGTSRLEATLSALWSGMECGMMFCGSDNAIVTGLQHLPHQRFNVWI